MSLFKPDAPPPPPPARKGPPPPRKKPVVVPQPEFDPAPPLARVALGEICFLRVRVTRGVLESMGPDMKPMAAAWVEILDGENPGMPGRTDCGILEKWLITKPQLIAMLKAEKERGA